MFERFGKSIIPLRTGTNLILKPIYRNRLKDLNFPIEKYNPQISSATAMSKNTSISLGQYFNQFVKEQVSAGRYKNISEVIRAGLRLLESEENKYIALKNAIQEGTNSGIAHDFDPQKNLKALKTRKNAGR